MKLFLHSLLLLSSFAFTFIWENTPLADFTVQTLGFLVVLYFIISARKKGAFSRFGDSYLSIFILNTVVLLLIFATGIFSSPLFFLLYFLGFGVAFVFEPPIVFVYVVGLALLFLPNILKDNVMENALRVGSVFLISPLAFFFGREFRERENEDAYVDELKQNSKEAAESIAKNVESVLTNEGQNMTTDDKERLDQALSEAETLRQEAE